jgi:hypothetical protein
MIHPLDGARLKVVRAEAHLKAVKSEIRSYLDGRPYKIGSYRANDGRDYPCVDMTSEPPLILSAIVGDCLCAIRAPLDYIAWELAGRYFRNPVRSDEDRLWVSFPIYDVPDSPGFVNKINRFANRQLPAEAITEIRAVQPNNGGYESLWWLHELVNADKHRMPHLTSGSSGEFIYAQIRGHDGKVHQIFPAFDHDLDEDGGNTGYDKAKQELRIPVFVAFKDSVVPSDMPIHEALANIIKTVADVIPRFDPFLA